MTASGRAWRHRLALKYSRYYRGEPAAPDTPSHSSNSTTYSPTGPKFLSTATNADAFILIYKINGQDVTTEQEYVNDLSQLQSGESFTVNLIAVDSQGNEVKGTDTTLSLTAP